MLLLGNIYGDGPSRASGGDPDGTKVVIPKGESFPRERG